ARLPDGHPRPVHERPARHPAPVSEHAGGPFAARPAGRLTGPPSPRSLSPEANAVRPGLRRRADPMERLIQGIHQFQKEHFRSLHGLFQQLARGQNPETLFITCSDSRIDPCLLTQSRPGDLFILRNAGNIVPPHGTPVNGEAATVEYAVAVLGVKDVIVCGHAQCGAMKALLSPEGLRDLPALAAWLRYAEATRRVIQASYGHLSGEHLLSAAVEENLLTHLTNLP